MSDSFTFNFNAPVGQNIAKVDKMIVNMDKEGKIQVMNADSIEMPTDSPTEPLIPSISEEEFFKYIHYNVINKDERIRIHLAICNIVRLPKMQQVIDALKELMEKELILRTVKQDSMLSELRRLGLPDGSTPGFSDNNFFSAYKTISGF